HSRGMAGGQGSPGRTDRWRTGPPRTIHLAGRSVAWLNARALGARDRGFESLRPDHFPDMISDLWARRMTPGLRAPARSIYRSGVPRVEAESAPDACFAHGYLHARDRLWQMELNRRVARGELAELFGPIALPTDRVLRRLGFRRDAERDLAGISADGRQVL